MERLRAGKFGRHWLSRIMVKQPLVATMHLSNLPTQSLMFCAFLVLLAGCRLDNTPSFHQHSEGGFGGAGGEVSAAGGAGGGLSSGGQGGAGGEGIGGQPSWEVSPPTGPCQVAWYAPPYSGGSHVEECSLLEHQSNPPTDGNHYPRWAHFTTYTEPVPRGFWIHAMEHGAMVLSYNCPEGCPEQVAAMQAWVDALPVDPKCDGAFIRTRTLITPDPTLDVPVAASAWGLMMKGQCFDEVEAQKFYDNRLGKAPEDICFAGIDPFYEGSNVPAGCGEPR